MRLENKTAIVTGSGGGIGRATALRLAKEGASVIVCDVNQTGIDETVQLIEAQSGKANGVIGNVADRNDVQRVIGAALEKFGHLDILVNNAGINRDALTVRVKDGEIKMMSEEQWDAVLNVNLKGAWLMAQAAAVPMINQKYGRIVNTSSIAAQGNVGQANYSASKAGVIGLTRTLALEWARFNINVNCVAPGGVNTPMTANIPEQVRTKLLEGTPFKRWADPDEIAAVHAFLVSDDASYITGQVIWADGGVTLG
jgi:NAD(P)-dependent dehydrogenase (short-subunit alcohol dehydrogenase family)